MTFIYTPPIPSAPTLPGGVDGAVQYNGGGSFAGAADFVYSTGLVEAPRFVTLKGGVDEFDAVSEISTEATDPDDLFTRVFAIRPGLSNNEAWGSPIKLLIQGSTSTGTMFGGSIEILSSDSTLARGGNLTLRAGNSGSTGLGGTLLMAAGDVTNNLSARINITGGSSATKSILDISLPTDGVSFRVRGNTAGAGGIGVRYLSGTMRVGFYGVTEIARPTTAYAAGAFVANASANIVYNESTFSGYTIGSVVAALRGFGLLT